MIKWFLYILVPIIFTVFFTSTGFAVDKGPDSYSIQIGAYLQEKNANKMVSMLNGRGYSPYIYQTYNAKRQKLYIIRLGEYSRLEQAISAANQFKNLEKMPAIVTKVNSITPIKNRPGLQKERARVVQEAILGLTEASRSVLVLREYGGLAYQEIATALDIPLGTVMSRLNYARRQLKRALLPHFIHLEMENG